MEAGVVLLILGLGLLSGSALLAFSWAARDGQLDDLEAGARVIFDADEIDEGADASLASDRSTREKASEGREDGAP